MKLQLKTPLKSLILALTCSAAFSTFGCSTADTNGTSKVDQDGDGGSGGESNDTPVRYLLGTISIDAEGKRMSYAQVIEKLDGHFSAKDGIEAGGNAVFLARGSDFFYGLAEEPTWVKYSTKDGFEETGRLSFANYGLGYTDFANVIVDDETAVSILTSAYVAVVWNPKTMEITGEIDLSYIKKDGLDWEGWVPTAHDGLVYLPVKWVNWVTPVVEQKVHVAVLDPKKLEIVSKAEDDRCGAISRVIFDKKGYKYVLADGRNQSMQTFAASVDKPVVPNCILRIAPGATDFEKDYFFAVPDLTGGLDSMTGLEAGDPNSGVGFSMLKYEDILSKYEEDSGEPLDRVNFEHWSVPAYKLWRFTFGDEPKAEVVKGANFSVVGFGGNAVDGKLYESESEDGSESTVIEIDPTTNTAVEKFTAEGYVSALLPLR